MGALTVTFAIRRYGIPDAVMLSLVTSSIMLGMKLDKLTLLKHWYAIVAWRGSSLLWQALVASVDYGAGGTRSAHGKPRWTNTRWSTQS
jgi:hypothetical protein